MRRRRLTTRLPRLVVVDVSRGQTGEEACRAWPGRRGGWRGEGGGGGERAEAASA